MPDGAKDDGCDADLKERLTRSVTPHHWQFIIFLKI